MAFKEAGPVLLEPIVVLEITVPEANMGDVIGDLSSRRGQVLGTDTSGGKAVIRAQVPLAEVLRYSNDLRSMTGGRGVFTMQFLRYERVPAHLQAEIVAQAQKEKQEEA